MKDLNFDPITAVIKAIISLAASPIKYQLERNEIIIELRKKLGISPDHPPKDFTGVYRNALVEYTTNKIVEYGFEKPQPLFELFHQEEIIQAFSQAYSKNDISILIREGENFLDWHILGDRIREMKFDILKEFTEFDSIFSEVVYSARDTVDVSHGHKIDVLKQTLEVIINALETPRWDSYVNSHSVEGLVNFELVDTINALGIAEPDDNERREIPLGQGFFLKCQIPFTGYALLMQGLQGFSPKWAFIRIGEKFENSKNRLLKERIAMVSVGSWSVPTHGKPLKVKANMCVGLNRFVLLLSHKPFPQIIQEIIVQETNEISSSALNTLVKYLEDDPLSVKLLVAECEIIIR
jgi:hypothetical protein